MARLTAMLGGDAAAARGHLELLWDVAYEAGEPFLGDAHDVEAAAHWRGTPGELAAALAGCGGPGRPGFIEPVEGGAYRVHDFFDHAPEYVRKRRLRELERESGVEYAKLAELARTHAIDLAVPPDGKALRKYASGKGISRTPAASNGGQRRPVDDFGRPPAPAPAPAPLLPFLTSEELPSGSGIPTHSEVGPGPGPDRRAVARAELDWRIEDVWAAHLRIRERFFTERNGQAPPAPELTSDLRKTIREALEEHDHARLGPEDRERWVRESPVRGAGLGLFLSPHHTGKNERNELYVEPWRPWKRLRGGADPVPGFAQRYFEARAQKEASKR